MSRERNEKSPCSDDYTFEGCVPRNNSLTEMDELEKRVKAADGIAR
jgi:hypothetical protein